MREAKCLTGLEFQILTDQELVDLAQHGDSEAFGELVSRYQNRIYRLARRFTDSREDAEDVLQEAFTRAFRAIGGFKGASKFSTWLFRITVNLAAMRRRAQRHSMESLDEPVTTADGEIMRDIRDKGATPLEALVDKELQEHLDQAISGLSPTNRAVFVLRHIEGLSTEETREVLKISVPAVKSRLHRARLTLQERLLSLAPEEAEAVCVG
jgi:RNA polymerase sigma-70 factor (ECF subfamily)